MGWDEVFLGSIGKTLVPTEDHDAMDRAWGILRLFCDKIKIDDVCVLRSGICSRLIGTRLSFSFEETGRRDPPLKENEPLGSLPKKIRLGLTRFCSCKRD